MNMSTTTASASTNLAIRQTLASLEIPLDVQQQSHQRRWRRGRAQDKEASASSSSSSSSSSRLVPTSILESLQPVEPDAASLARSWTRFGQTVDDLVQARRRNMPQCRDAVFVAGMSNACAAFNQGTESVKLEMITKESKTTAPTDKSQRRNPNKNHRTPQFMLRVSCLNRIDDELRRTAFCSADIPNMPPAPVQAEPMTAADDDHSVPAARVEIVEERPVVLQDDTTTTDNTQQDDQAEDPPLVVQVVTVVDDAYRSMTVPDSTVWTVDDTSGQQATPVVQGELL